MKRSSRFQMLLKLEEAKERDEARRFADQRRVLDEKRRKLSELENYLGEYHERFSNLGRSGTGGGQLRAGYAFIGQLKEAIGQQQQMVLEEERVVEEYRQYWLEAKQRVDILQKTMDKMLEEEAGRDRKKEQLIADEAARRKFHST